MSLLDSGQRLELYPDVEDRDGDQNRIRRPRRPDEGPSTSIVGRFVYDRSTEDASAGQVLTTAGTFRCRRFPAGFAGRVVLDGREWDVDGEPARIGLSAATRHYVVHLVARAPRSS